MAFSQKLPVDEKGKITFTDVVKADSIKAGRLYANAKNWLTARGYEIEKADSTGGQIMAKYIFPVYDKGYVSKKLNGKISCDVVIDVKDNKYRYQLSNFEFAYFKEDRNYKFSPTGKKKKLEEPLAKGWQPLWDQHKKTTENVVKTETTALKTGMLSIEKAPEEIAKKKTLDW